MTKGNWVWAAVAGLMMICTSARAGDGKAPWEELENRLKTSQSVGALGDDLFGDTVSLANGGLSFAATDVEIPGNTGLRVAFGRRYTVYNHWEYTNTGSPLADWDLDVPSISGVFAPNWTIGDPYVNSTSGARCSSYGRPTQPLRDYSAEDFWHGNTLSIPGVGGGELLKPNGNAMPTSDGPYLWITADNVRISCLSAIKNGAGEGFMAITPDGTRYWFDWMAQYNEPTLAMVGRKDFMGGVDTNPVQRRKNVLYATRVQDRFGHSVDYTYTNAWNAPAVLTKIAASDGRQITLAYQSSRITTVTAGTRKWIYTYGSTPKGRPTLTRVQLPDLSTWQIGFAPLSDAYIEYRVGSILEPARTCLMTESPLNAGDQPVGTITHPSGAVGTFRIGIETHGRSNVPVACYNVTTSPSDGPPGMGNDPNDDMNQQAISYDSLTLLAKTISGPAIATKAWSYSYNPGVSFYLPSGVTVRYPVCRPWGPACYEPRCLSDDCAGSSTTTVVESGGKWTRHTFGNSYRYNEGKLLKIEQGSDASHILRTETRQYDLSLADQAYPAEVGSAPWRQLDETFATIYTRPLLRTTISQQGATFDWQVMTGCEAGSHCFDAFARPTSVRKFSSTGYSKTETTQYHDDYALWVLNQVARTTTNGVETSRTEFGWMALPWKIYAFGKLRQTIGYYTSGTPGSISSVTDGNGNKTWLKSWKRGVPQTIQYPATPDQPSGTSSAAVVDDNGWIGSVTDENGYKTSYGYDVMGRLSSITYPSGDSPAWTPTAQAFVRSAQAKYGLPAGHWQQTIHTGNGYKIVYYDGMWRPVVEESYDSGNASATRSIVVKRYDASGRLAFQSYPVGSLGSYADAALKGMWTDYDALDRVMHVRQDWEGAGQLTTATAYLFNTTGPYTQVTNPRGAQVRTWYQDYDQPSFDAPVIIQNAGTAYSEITRNPFGKPTSITRRNSTGSVSETRTYAYNAQQELCRQVEPETGATVLGYDGVGNLAWSASGVVSTIGCDPEGDHSAIAPRRVDRAYDARNRLKTLSFPNGDGNQTWTYTPDGLPASIVTTMLSDGRIVTNEYAYNHRRLLATETQRLTGWGTYTLTRAYDANGHLASLKYPANYVGSVVDYAPNALGQPTKAGAYASAVAYYPNGAIKSFTYGNGLKHTLTQNLRGLPDTRCDFASSCSSSAVINDGYDYDQNANVAAISDGRTGNRGHRTMTYDALDRLTQVVSPMFGTAAYSYDALDNLTRVKLTGGNQIRDHYYCYDAKWQLTNVKTGSCSGATVMGLGYDLQGNLANRSGVAYKFDYGNRLREVVGRENQFLYDGHGRRTLSNRLVNGSSARRSIYSQGGQLLFVQDQGEAQRKEYIYLGGSLIAERSLPNTGAATPVSIRYQHTDALGSPVAVTNESKGVVEKSEYEPYGWPSNRLARSGPGYTGHHEDAATGLVYMQQRYYDPQIGRFLSVDPVTAYSNPVGAFNRYWYANNNPYRFKDPDGRKCTTTDGKDSCTFDEFKDRKGNAMTREQALSGGNKLTRALGIDRGSRILKAEAGMTAKYTAAKGLAAKGGEVTIKGNSALGIPDQKVSGAAIVGQMENVRTIANDSSKPGNSSSAASTQVALNTGYVPNTPINFWSSGWSSGAAQTFGHEILHTLYSGAGLTNGGWTNGLFNLDHQTPFNDASDEIK